MNLGEKLKANIEKSKEYEASKAKTKALHDQKELDRVLPFYEEVKKHLEISITNGAVPTGRRIPRPYYETPDTTLGPHWNSARMKNQPAWADFEKWCEERGLKAKIVWGHDGIGIQDWFTLEVEPLRSFPL